MKYVGQTCDLHIHRSGVWSINMGLTIKQAIKLIMENYIQIKLIKTSTMVTFIYCPILNEQFY